MLLIAAGNSKPGRDLMSVFVGLGFLGLVSACSALYSRGEQHLRGTADDAIAADRRSPVLYLRSFDDEYQVSIEEEVLADILGEIGPFVAIGRPEDALPPLGAYRKYLPKGPWKPHVQALIDKAQLVILVAGKTEGLSWEMAECQRRLSPEKLVVLVQRDAASYEAFRRQVGAANASLRLPAFPSKGDARYHAGEFAGLIRFDPNWRGTFQAFEKAAWVGKGHEMATRETALENRLRVAFSRVDAGRGQIVAAPRTNWLKIGFVGYLVAIAVFGIFMAWLVATGRLE